LLRPVGLGRALVVSATATSGRVRSLMLRLVAVAVGVAILWTLVLAVLSGLLDWLLAQRFSDITLDRVCIAFAILAAVIFAALSAVSRASLALVLIAHPAADNALPARARVSPIPRALASRRLAVLLICAVIPAGALLEAARASRASRDRLIAITAHRAGSARAPENTLAALETAIAEGADVVEIDVQETADGYVVLLHDTDLRRVAGVARSIWDMPLKELQALDVGSWFSSAFHGERVPTLREFAAASRGRVRLNVELKNNRRGEDLAARAVAVLRETGTADEAAVSSLDVGLLRAVRQIAPEIKLGLILATGIGDIRRVDVDFLALSRRLATPAVIRQLHATGREVHVWTVDDEASIGRAMLDGADNVITGDTLLAVKVRDWFDGLSEPERTLLRISRRVGTPRMSPGMDVLNPDDL
jgi:glycerophosphoryl diester phosphodiesterase